MVHAQRPRRRAEYMHACVCGGVCTWKTNKAAVVAAKGVVSRE